MIACSASAVEHIAQQNKFLRIRVKSGGCSGLQVLFSFESQPASADHILEQEGARIIVDPLSFVFIEGSELDYVSDMMASHFQLRNPRAQKACSCGVSFSL